MVAPHPDPQGEETDRGSVRFTPPITMPSQNHNADKALRPRPGQLPAAQSLPGYKDTARTSDDGGVARIRRLCRIRVNTRRRKACRATKVRRGHQMTGGSPDKAVMPHPGQHPAAQSLPGYKGTARASDVGVVARIRRLRRIRERGQGKAIKP